MDLPLRRFERRILAVMVGVLLFAALTGARPGLAMTNPQGCSETGSYLVVRELRDSDGMTLPGETGPGDLPITGSKVQGETIYYEARLSYVGYPECGYEGGTLCIDPPGPQGCTDVTPPGGIALVCGDPICSPPGARSVRSMQLSYVVDFAHADTTGSCAGQIRALAEYRDGVSHFGPDVFPLNATAPICNPVTTPTPATTPVTTALASDSGAPATGTPAATATPAATPTRSATSTPAWSATTPTPIAPQPTATGGRHFQCYNVPRAPFATIPGVSLVDERGASTATVMRPTRLCNPASKNGEDPAAPTAPEHLLGYKIEQTAPEPAPLRNQTIANQFGTTVLDLGKPIALLVPSATSSTGSPAEPAAGLVDHFKCYRVIRTGGRPSKSVTVADEFGTLLVDLKRPRALCAPVDKNGEGVLDPLTHLLCYKVRLAMTSPPFEPSRTVFVKNQFGDTTIDRLRPTELCVPSWKSTP